MAALKKQLAGASIKAREQQDTIDFILRNLGALPPAHPSPLSLCVSLPLTLSLFLPLSRSLCVSLPLSLSVISLGGTQRSWN